MKKLLLTTLLSVSMGLAAQAISVQYSSSTQNGVISFNGASGFSFNPGANSFQVTSGSAVGLQGDISGSFAIGVPVGFSAPVTGSGNFVIHDGAFDFKGTVMWNTITEVGAGGGLNTVTASANLSGITYLGANADLITLKNGILDKNVLSFQFTSPVSLNDLITTQVSTSFSGTISTPDGGTTVMLLGCALLGMAALRGMFKRVTV